jgi:2-polyprenyl-3-methyl-5-hydroxy-6-metoxy-1,4-benzoquinol methylase
MSKHDLMNKDFSNCPICNADIKFISAISSDSFIEIDYTKETLNEIEINYLHCSFCGGVSQANPPTLEQLTSYYATCSAHGLEDPPKATIQFFLKRFHDLLMATNPGHNFSILEIGCASGEFASMLVSKGYKVYGVEPGESSSMAASQRGIKILSRSIEEIDPKYEGFFDLVFSMGTFEHLPMPRVFLQQMIKLVKSNGYIYIDLPDNEYISDGGETNWGSNIILPHLHHFTPMSLFLMLSQNSLSPVFLIDA